MGGCIVAAPETSIYLDREINRHLCKKGENHCRNGHGYCDDFGVAPVWPANTAQIVQQMNGFCYTCPIDRVQCNSQVCRDECFDKKLFVRSECDTASGNSDCEKGEFCYGGVCQLCSIVVPKGDVTKCDNRSPPFSSGELENCKANCAKTYEQEPEPPKIDADYVRFSRMEQLPADNGEPYGGYCVGFESKAGGVSVEKQTLCESGTADDSFTAFNYAAEIDPQCAERFCSNEGGVSTGAVRWTGAPKYVESYCMVRVKNSNKPCLYNQDALINGKSEILKLAGRCVNGECLPKQAPNFQCPDGYTNSVDSEGIVYYTPEEGTGCKKTFISEFPRNVQNKNRCGRVITEDGRQECETLPRANKAAVTMYSHNNNGWADEGDTNEENDKISAVWGYPVDYIDAKFWFMMFTEEPITAAVNTTTTTTVDGKTTTETTPDPSATLEDITISIGDTEKNYQGRALVCDPDMTDIYKEDYGCLIDSYGQYYYQGSEITFYGFSNGTTRVRHFEAEPNIVTAMPILLCGSVATRNCFGGVQIDYEKSNTVQQMCSEKYAICQEGTASPTAEPTRRATSHGDPIIWTFHDECYDLNKDGLYDATANPKFNHVVKLGVYNEFMRELQVVSTNGEVLLSINSLGEYEKSDNFLYRFKYEEKECPVGMKDTECVGTYKEWMFDAQEFEYTVHLLRHDYKDNGIPEGDLGYHLDIYPRPYKSFRKPGHLDSYSGLFFENPLPEELEYCVGGSTRNEHIKLEQSKPKDATVFA